MTTGLSGDAWQQAQAWMRERTTTGKVSGLSLAVTGPDGLIHAEAYGVADLATGRPITERTPYLWFSMTKIVTATAVMRLADEGRLDLETPVSEYVPGYPRGRDGVATVRQLLDHTAGLANPLPVRWVRPAGRSAPDQEAFLAQRMRRHLKPKHPIGGEAHYSNLGYLILGAVVARASGTTYEQYVHDAVLAPAGMERTGFDRPPETAVGYVGAPRPLGVGLKAVLPRGIVGERHGELVAFAPFLVNGAAYGGLVGDAVDAARLAALHLRDGAALDGTRVLRPETARAMREISTPGRPVDLGIGWYRAPDKRDSAPTFAEHHGGGGGYYTAIRIYPTLGLGMVLMVNATKAPDVHALFDLLRQVPWERPSNAGGLSPGC